MNTIIIYGAAFGDVVKLIDAINRFEASWIVSGFLDDTRELRGKFLMGYPILGGRELLPDLATREGIFFINNVNGSRDGNRAIAALLDASQCTVPTLIHPYVDLAYVTIGRGCIIPDGCVIGANVTIGDFVTLRYGSVISHDAKIGDHVLIGPGATVGGRVVINRGCEIGAGATIKMETTIGEGATVGAGTVVIRDVLPGTVVAGVPGKEIHKQ